MSTLSLYDLKSLHEKTPLGIDRKPYFSWKLASQEENTLQTAWQLQVISPKGGIIWDSGKVESDASTFVSYEGKELESRTRYRWTITVWDNHGQMAREESWFETALLHQRNWVAQWISAPKPEKKRKKGFGNQPAPVMFRRAFSLEKEVASARLYVTCHGIYRLYVNGQRPDDRDFAPEYTSYDKYLLYQTYDVTPLLKKGENALGLYVADGWYYCPITTMNKKTAKEPYHVLYQLEIIYADGSKARFASDGSETVSRGPVAFSDLFAGEKYDAREEQPGWSEAGFDDGTWDEATLLKGRRSYGIENLAAQIGQPVRAAAVVQAVNSYISPKGEHIIDFGQNMAGRVRMHVKAPAGTEITLDHFEIPDKEGNYFNNILGAGGVGEGCDQKVLYISNGKETSYEAMFSFQGFRYIRVSGLDEVKAEDFQAISLSTDKEELGTFTCSDIRLNRLYENTRWSQRSNMISIPTDCPQREKAGWTGDIGLYAPTSLLNEDTTGLLTRWLRSVSFDQAKDGAVPMVVPYNQTYRNLEMLLRLMVKSRSNVGPAGWGDACILVPLAMYRQTGNRQILEEQYETMRRWCEYIIHEAENNRGNKQLDKEIDRKLWNTGFHYGEWLIPSQNKNGMGDGAAMGAAIKEGIKYVPEIYGILAMRNFADISAILGKDREAAYYKEMEKQMTQAFQKGCIQADGSMPVDFMGAYTMALHYDLVPTEWKEVYKEKLLTMIRENDGCLDTGFLATPILLDTLCKIGHTELAYDLLFQTKSPSWLYEVEHGATTIWESWITASEEGDPYAVSLNHYSFGCVDDWIFRNVTGIRPVEAGFHRFRVEITADDRLQYASRTYETEYGKILVDWKREGGRMKLQVTVPCNTTAEIVLPDGSLAEKGSGNYCFE